MGNINSLNRTGGKAASLAYTYYNGGMDNRLQTVINNTTAFRSYAYDANGNATTDGGGKTLEYNLLNLPQQVKSGTSTIATYTYDATGAKLRNTGSDGSWDYISGIVYRNGTISFIQTEEGRAELPGGNYRYGYNLKDHLGNTRLSFDKDPSNNTARRIQEDEYYPFGLRNSGGYDYSSNNRYLYNGKEIQTDLTDQYDYGARFYDPVIARWTSVDPLAEEMRSHSVYNYGLNNPMRYTDPDGNAPTDIIIRGAGNSSITVKTELIDIEVNASSLGVNFGGNYTLNGDAVLQAGLDIVGIFDPTGVADAINAGISAKNGDYLDAGISAVGLIPYAGDLAKAGKVKKDIKIVEEAVDAVKKVNKNSNSAVGDFVLYDVKNGDEMLKVGKADAGRVTASGDPVRMKASERAAKKAGYPDAQASVRKHLGETTTKEAKKAEAAEVKAERAKGNKLPLNKERGKNYN